MIFTDPDTIRIDDLIGLAYEIGFSQAAPLEMSALIFREDVRSMCAADKCRSYGRCWSCPPATGSLETIREKVSCYRRGIIVQTTGAMDGDFDIDAVREISSKHTMYFDTLVRQIRNLFPACLPMGAGACTRCRRCTYPDRQCRHPDKLYPSMEAYGLWVSDVCVKSGLEYNYGPQTMTYTSCILVD